MRLSMCFLWITNTDLLITYNMPRDTVLRGISAILKEKGPSLYISSAAWYPQYTALVMVET